MSTRFRPLEGVISGAYHFLVEQGFVWETSELIDKWWPNTGKTPARRDQLRLLQGLRMLLHEHFPAEVAARFDR